MVKPELSLTPNEERQMDVISNAIIDLILSNPERYLKKELESNILKLDNKKTKT